MIKYLLLFVVFFFSCSLILNETKDFRQDNLYVNYSNEVGNFVPLTNHINTSLRKVPPFSIADSLTNIYGRSKMSRLWLNLDEMWDYRYDTYKYNFRINDYQFEDDSLKYLYNWPKFEPSDVYFEDYLRTFCPISDDIILNVKRYQVEVLNNLITMEQWKTVLSNALQRYKSICPNLNYVEVLNETRLPQFGDMTDDQYYDFYKASYQVINQINQNLPPLDQIKIGGPASHGISLLDTRFDAENFQISNKGQQLYNFLKNYRWDRNSEKRLDFISFHEYHIRDTPNHLSKYEEVLREIFRKSGMYYDKEIFITEIGIGSPKRIKNNIYQAIGMYSLYKQNLSNENILLFPWVIYHTDEQQSLVMFDGDLNLTKFGQSSKLFNQHAEIIVESTSYDLDENGIGVDILATKGNDKYVVQYWNYSDQDKNIIIEINNLSEPLNSSDYIINFLSSDQNLTSFTNIEQIDSTYNFSIDITSDNLVETLIPSFSTVLIEIDK